MASRIPFLLLGFATACGAVDGPSVATDAKVTTHEDDANTDIETVPIDAMIVDRTCAEVKARLATSTDGVYWIDPDLEVGPIHPFRVFCAGMATVTPVEFLELAHTSQPADMPSSNYSTYATGTVHASWTCNCGVAASLFSKVRIDPTTLIATADPRFAVYSSSTNVSCLHTMSGCPGLSPYGAALSCNGNYDSSGRANVDLRGLPFHVAGHGTDTSMFVGNGFTPAGAATIDAARKVVDLTGGGDCGSFGVVSGLQLEQD